MIAAEKVNVYREYHGWYDGYYIKTKSEPERLVSDKEWGLIDNLLQDLTLVRRGVAAESFKEDLNRRLKESCDNEETIKQLVELEVYLHRSEENS
jgi:hypothetical protein